MKIKMHLFPIMVIDIALSQSYVSIMRNKALNVALNMSTKKQKHNITQGQGNFLNIEM